MKPLTNKNQLKTGNFYIIVTFDGQISTLRVLSKPRYKSFDDYPESKNKFWLVNTIVLTYTSIFWYNIPTYESNRKCEYSVRDLGINHPCVYLFNFSNKNLNKIKNMSKEEFKHLFRNKFDGELLWD